MATEGPGQGNLSPLFGPFGSHEQVPQTPPVHEIPIAPCPQASQAPRTIEEMREDLVEKADQYRKASTFTGRLRQKFGGSEKSKSAESSPKKQYEAVLNKFIQATGANISADKLLSEKVINEIAEEAKLNTRIQNIEDTLDQLGSKYPKEHLMPASVRLGNAKSYLRAKKYEKAEDQINGAEGALKSFEKRVSEVVTKEAGLTTRIDTIQVKIDNSIIKYSKDKDLKGARACLGEARYQLKLKNYEKAEGQIEDAETALQCLEKTISEHTSRKPPAEKIPDAPRKETSLP